MPSAVRFLSGILCRVPAQAERKRVTAVKLAGVMSEVVRAGLQSLKSRVVPAAVDGPLVGALLQARDRIH